MMNVFRRLLREADVAVLVFGVVIVCDPISYVYFNHEWEKIPKIFLVTNANSSRVEN